ncbi:MAG TPA: sulfatase-like hydrolase/transferase [Bacteroidia bacterium]|nr:sulfatase-like hydrolase/transferase [Bacteroidia bacterium]
MLRRRLKLYTYHTFLTVPFIVLFLFVHNLEISRVEMTYRTLFYGTLLCILLYALTQTVYRNRLKTGVFVTILLFFLFQYGVVYEGLESLYYQGIWPFRNIHRYLLLIYLICSIGLFLFILKSAYDFVRINYFLNALLIILLLTNLGKLLLGSYETFAESEGQNPTPQPAVVFSKQSPRPDIYYILLDGYASDAVLRKYYHFENTAFRKRLSELGFLFVDSAIANYYYTSPSLASTLNFTFLNDSSNRTKLIRGNRLFRILRQNGYSIYHTKSGYAVSNHFNEANEVIRIEGPNEFEKSILKFTILRLDDLIGLFAHQRLQSQFKKMYELVQKPARPKFCFLHVVAPHPPYVFDRQGKLRTKHRFAENSWEPKNYYTDQLVYVNSQIQSYVSTIRKKDPKAIIILQSDHGPWINAKRGEYVFEARSGILYAYYSEHPLNIPSKTSSVNTFPLLLNSLFDCKLSLLQNASAGKTELLRDPVFLKKIQQNR